MDKDGKNANPAEYAFILRSYTNVDDIISLIYYWADIGIISIEEIDNPPGEVEKHIDKTSHGYDYGFTKNRELLENSKSFEKVLFDILFKDGKGFFDVIGLKKRSGGIDKMMEMAIEEYIDNEKYYVGKTREFGKKCRIAAEKMGRIFSSNSKRKILILIVLTLTLIIIPYYVLFIILKILSKIIPIRTKNGKEIYKNAKNMKKEISKEKKKGVTLAEFSKHLPYAFAFNSWEELTDIAAKNIKEMPEWYRGYGEYKVEDFFKFVKKSYYVLNVLFTNGEKK